MAEDKAKKDKELDEFWNLDALMPKKSPRIPLRQPGHTEAVDVIGDTPVKSADTENQFKLTRPADSSGGARMTRRDAPELPESEYNYDKGLVHSVKVFNWKLSYNCFEQFCRDGERLLNLRGKPCEKKQFFSYIPQYSQLDQEQLLYYIYWRQEVRAGVFHETDFSYIMLYIFELINVTSKENAPAAQSMLCRLLVNYGRENPRLVQYLSEWIPDFSMIYGLPVPIDELKSVYGDLISYSSFKEYYIGANTGNIPGSYESELADYCSNYLYKLSKFYTDETRELYDKLMCGAVGIVTEHMKNRNGVSFIKDASIKRDTFVGALCSYRIKKRLEISYCSISRTHELRMIITDTVKHTENRIRTYLGVRSRLGVFSIPEDILKELDAYIDANLPSRVKPKPVPDVPEYERLYDLPKTEFSPERAAEIERASWETTERLVEAFEDDTATVVCEPAPTVNLPIEPVIAEGSVFGEYNDFIKTVLDGDIQGQQEWARAHGKLLDAVADTVNELATESEIGDVILEECDGGYSIIGDYADDVTKMICN